MEVLTMRAARRLALARAGLLKPEWTALPRRARGRGRRARSAAHAIVRRFGYLQLDTVSIAGARSHAIVLMSRLEGFEPDLAEELLQPGEPLFEYWGHEASWIPIELYPLFEFRRRAFRSHPWWGDIINEHGAVARSLRKRVREDGAIRSIEMEGRGSRGWWDLKIAKRVAAALWSSGEFAIRERRSFQRSYDLAKRVIPEATRCARVPRAEALESLLLKALDGHGWATTGTLAQTWRLRNMRADVARALERLAERGTIVACGLAQNDCNGHGAKAKQNAKPTRGWIAPADLDLAARLERVRPRRDEGVLLSPFDPVLWDRARVARLFDFDQILEIFKPAPQREYGYYCLPVLAGERLVARFDLKADRRARRLRVLSCRFEGTGGRRPPCATDGAAATAALERYAGSLQLDVTGWSCPTATAGERHARSGRPSRRTPRTTRA